MKPVFKSSMTGIAIALAAASMAACAYTGGGKAATGNTTDLVHCYGVNKCKGMNDCKTAGNACGGKASCKGHGFVAMPSKACADVGGKQKDSWEGSVSKADLIHCNGVNICGGHNDCKTANNACAGKASCKGQGFVVTTAKSCSSIGGTKGG